MFKPTQHLIRHNSFVVPSEWSRRDWLSSGRTVFLDGLLQLVQKFEQLLRMALTGTPSPSSLDGSRRGPVHEEERVGHQGSRDRQQERGHGQGGHDEQEQRENDVVVVFVVVLAVVVVIVRGLFEMMVVATVAVGWHRWQGPVAIILRLAPLRYTLSLPAVPISRGCQGVLNRGMQQQDSAEQTTRAFCSLDKERCIMNPISLY